MLPIPNTTTTATENVAGAAIFPATDSGALTPYASGFLIVSNASARVSIRKGRTSGSSGSWTPYTLVQPTLIPFTTALGEANPEYIYGVKAIDGVAGTHAQVFGAFFQKGEAAFTPGSQFLGTVSPGGGFTPTAPVTAGTALVTFPAGSSMSNVLVVNHGLPATPTAVVATFIAASFGGVLCVCQTVLYTPTTVSLAVQTVDGSIPGAGANANVAWLAST